MANDNRNDRTTDDREMTLRVKEWAPASLLPEVQAKPGWAYRWIRTSMVGNADAVNVSSKLREGWEPVKITDHPELHLYTDPHSTSRFKDFIEIGGLLLCKAPQEMVDQRNAYYKKQAKAQNDAVDNHFMKESDPRAPLFKESKSNVVFGSGKK